MHHSFDISIAEKYDVNIAIFLNNMAFWIKKNQANNKHFYNGRYWTYNSSRALSELFPYWSEDQMDRIIKKCVSLGLILLDNFNESSYDRTRWYGLTDIGLSLFNFTIPQNRGMNTAKSETPFREIAEPIPDIKPDIKPDKENISCSSDDERSFEFTSFDYFWSIYPRKQKKMDAKKIWDRKKLDEKATLICENINMRLKSEWKDLEKKFIPLPSSFLNGERWTDENIITPGRKESGMERAARLCLN